MVDNATFGVQSADAWAWIDASVVGAALVARTVRILDAFRPAAAVRIADVVWWTFTRRAVALSSASGSDSARCWIARIFRPKSGGLRLDDNRLGTADERVTGHASRTGANGIVISDDAIGSDSADARTRIDAFLVDAGLVLGTIAAGHTFRPARSAEIAGQARTDGLVIDWSTFGVRTARTGIARLGFHRLRHNGFGRYKFAVKFFKLKFYMR